MIVKSGAVRYRTQFSTDFLFRNRSILNDLTGYDNVRVSTPLNHNELRNPREEDKNLAKKLIAHLNEHIEHYHKAIWWNMDKARRYMLLDGIIAPNSNGRSVASVIENRLIGVVGNCLIMPVARGFHLDPTYSQNVKNPVDLLHHYAPTTPIAPSRISVPTQGVFAESVMGSCNSCEEIDDSRFWRFEESPCPDLPTPISTISTESRRAEPGDLTAKDFPTPMINLQNAPPAPDPTGLAAAFNLLSRPDLFRDITGLDQTQKNAIAAFQASMEGAKFIAEQAANLKKQEMMNKNVGRNLQTIDRANKTGQIDDNQANKLSYDALKGLVGSDNYETIEHLTDEPEIKDLIKSGREKGLNVNVDRIGESVKVTDPSIPSGIEITDAQKPLEIYKVEGEIPKVYALLKFKVCWATCAARMLSWKNKTEYSVEETVELMDKELKNLEIEPIFKALFDRDAGLSKNDCDNFEKSLGMFHPTKVEDLDVPQLKTLLTNFGPFIACVDKEPWEDTQRHMKIVYGYEGDGTINGTFLYILDPTVPPTEYLERFSVFKLKLKQDADISGEERIYFFHKS
jgi:hypothetical protein